MTFDLLSQPWLPCRRQDGSRTELGLTALFEQAHEIESLDDPSPLVTLALHRLLLAILHRTVGPSSLRAWKELYASGRMPTDRINEYLNEQKAAFDLLHPERPFYQTRGLPTEYRADGVGRLVLERSSYGNEVLVLQHRPSSLESDDSLSFAEAARHLVALHAFAPGGLVRKRDEPGSASAAPLNRGAFVMVRGSSLFDTLLLNLVIYDPENAMPFAGEASTDRPSWEQPPLARPTSNLEPKRAVHGYLDWLTWQSRRVELSLSEDQRRVRGVVYCVGVGVVTPAPRDPMLAYREDKTRGVVAIDISETRSLWRECHAFVRETGADGDIQPTTVSQLRARSVAGFLPKATRTLVVLGMRGDQAKIRLSRSEQLAIPEQVLLEPNLQGLLLGASQAAEQVGAGLRLSLRIAATSILSPGKREPHKDDVTKLVSALGGEAAYWAALSEPFQVLLNQLAEHDEEALSRFETATTRAATTALSLCCARAGGGSRQMKALALAEAHLLRKTVVGATAKAKS